MYVPHDHIMAVDTNAKHKARPWMKNWHARQLGAKSKEACNMQTITRSYVWQDDCILVLIERLALAIIIIVSALKSRPRSWPNTLHKEWWLSRAKTVAWNTWATCAFDVKLTLCLVYVAIGKFSWIIFS